MDEITHFIVIPYDRADQELVAGQQLKCATPSSAIEHAKHLWKTIGHAGAVALVSTGYPERKTTVLRKFGMVPDDQIDEACQLVASA
ncbi:MULTISPECIES: hypothetical protein [Bradyrhizobium]|uniref:hypothetical protein n=1 Tax=Bradyrhizobium TaxID=374 RepID=UPI00067E9771|nr:MULTISPECIES: hypothetical protein [Bradyrhizobium]PAY10345.1 hypothetical protein CK489_07390 [Bradyrhizobium sp. UFLA03-84]